MDILDLQNLMRSIYFKKDSMRGLEKTMLWLVSEVGELAQIISKNNIQLNKRVQIESDLENDHKKRKVRHPLQWRTGD